MSDTRYPGIIALAKYLNLAFDKRINNLSTKLVKHIDLPSKVICSKTFHKQPHGKITFLMLTIIIFTTTFMFFGKFILYFGPEAVYY